MDADDSVCIAADALIVVIRMRFWRVFWEMVGSLLLLLLLLLLLTLSDDGKGMIG